MPKAVFKIYAPLHCSNFMYARMPFYLDALNSVTPDPRLIYGLQYTAIFGRLLEPKCLKLLVKEDVILGQCHCIKRYLRF